MITDAVPEKVTEELFWRRFHARVLQMVEEKQLSIHLSKVTAPTKALDDSESEEVRHCVISTPTLFLPLNEPK